MKVLYLGSFQEAWNTECYIANAFERLGHEVVRLEETTSDQESILAAARGRRPDLFLFAKARFQGANNGWPADAEPIRRMIAALRPHVPRVACWIFDLMAREFRQERFEWALRVADACDLFATTDGATAPQLPHAVVVRQGVPDDVDQAREWQGELCGDVLFLGCAYQDRQVLVDALGRRFPGAPGFRVVNDVRCGDLTRLVRTYRVVVGPHYPHFAGYWSNRLYVVTGHGGLFAAPRVPGMDAEGWKPGQNYLALPLEPEAMAAQVEEYLRCDANQLESIRRAGFEHANRRCTYDHRVRELLGHLAGGEWPR